MLGQHPFKPPAGIVIRQQAVGHLYARHADTSGEPCDRNFRVGDRAGQRNISAAGRAQSAAIGARLAALGIPLAEPVLAHRLLMSSSFEASGGTAAEAVAEAIATVPAPPTDRNR